MTAVVATETRWAVLAGVDMEPAEEGTELSGLGAQAEVGNER